MEAATLLFVCILVIAGVFLTLIVRRDFVARDEYERERQRRAARQPRRRR